MKVHLGPNRQHRHVRKYARAILGGNFEKLKASNDEVDQEQVLSKQRYRGMVL